LSGKPLFDPARLDVPTLLIYAEWDGDMPGEMAQALFPRLVNAPCKLHVEIGEGTHTVIMEEKR